MRFKSLLRGTAVALAMAAPIALAPAPAEAADYAAIAAGPGGSSGVEGGYRSMDAARNAAVARCRNLGYGSCSASTAESSSWYFGAGYCDGIPYTAATPQGVGRLEEIIEMKGAADGNYGCYLNHWF